MSLNIYLVEYKKAKNGRLYETSNAPIEYSFATAALIQELSKSTPTVSLEIYESTDPDSSYSIECFREEDIDSAIMKLQEMFLEVLKADGKILAHQSPENTDVKNISTTINQEYIDDSINRFRTITNIINIFKIKKNKYDNNDSVVIKLV